MDGGVKNRVTGIDIVQVMLRKRERKPVSAEAPKAGFNDVELGSSTLGMIREKESFLLSAGCFPAGEVQVGSLVVKSG